MTTTTIVGTVADHLGAAMWTGVASDICPEHGNLRAWRYHRFDVSPGDDYADEQPSTIPVLWGHDHSSEIGEVVWLQRSEGRLSAVAGVDVDADWLKTIAPLYWSSSTRPTGPGGTLRIEELSLTTAPASVGLWPVRCWPGRPSDAACYHDAPRQLLRQAATAAVEYRRAGAGLLIDDVPRTSSDTGARVEHRSATTGAVDYARREIDVRAAPYDEPSDLVTHHGRRITESISNTAFLRESLRSPLRRIPVLRDHRDDRLVGRVTDLDPLADDGLHATARIAPTELGDETLQLAGDNCLSASVGMMVGPDGQRWDQTRNHRRILKAELVHLALVADPAYVGADVLAVRSAGERYARPYGPIEHRPGGRILSVR